MVVVIHKDTHVSQI